VDFANKRQEEGVSRAEAIEEAAATRLRPILMTTAATVVAMVPLLIADGAGAAARFNIGIVIAAGMTIGTIFTLFVTPAMYTYLARDYQRARARLEAQMATGGDVVHLGDHPSGETGGEQQQVDEKDKSPSASTARPKKRGSGRRRRKGLPTAAE